MSCNLKDEAQASSSGLEWAFVSRVALPDALQARGRASGSRASWQRGRLDGCTSASPGGSAAGILVWGGAVPVGADGDRQLIVSGGLRHTGRTLASYEVDGCRNIMRWLSKYNALSKCDANALNRRGSVDKCRNAVHLIQSNPGIATRSRRQLPTRLGQRQKLPSSNCFIVVNMGARGDEISRSGWVSVVLVAGVGTILEWVSSNHQRGQPATCKFN